MRGGKRLGRKFELFLCLIVARLKIISIFVSTLTQYYDVLHPKTISKTSSKALTA